MKKHSGGSARGAGTFKGQGMGKAAICVRGKRRISYGERVARVFPRHAGARALSMTSSPNAFASGPARSGPGAHVVPPTIVVLTDIPGMQSSNEGTTPQVAYAQATTSLSEEFKALGRQPATRQPATCNDHFQ